MTSILSILFMFTVLQQAAPVPAPVQNASPTALVGTWVGLQSWAIDNPSPGAIEPQTVTLTIELVDGNLVGTLTPFLGGTDAASFTNGRIVGNQLQAAGRIGAIQPAAASGNPSPPRGWKGTVAIAFDFNLVGVQLSGTADVQLDGVKWLKFKYDLSKKRSRY